MSKSIRKEEFIVCAGIYVSSVKDGYIGTRIVKGVTYEDIFKEGLTSEITHPTNCNILISGFITNKNRFVDQKEALEITGWKNRLHFKDKDHLTPEDLLYIQSLIINKGSVL